MRIDENPAESHAEKASVIVVGTDRNSSEALTQELASAGFQTSWSSASENLAASLVSSPDVVVFLPMVTKEIRTKIAKDFRTRFRSLKIVMLYERAITGAELADAVIHVRCEAEDLVRTVKYLTSKTPPKAANE